MFGKIGIKLRTIFAMILPMLFIASAYGIILVVEEPVPIAFGETKFGYINSTSEMDTYTFSANAGDNILIRMKSSWSDCNYYYGCQGNYGPQIRLYAPNGTLMQSVSGIDYVELNQKLPDDGEYQFLVGDTDEDNTGIYHVYIQRLNKPGKFFTIKSDETKDESINLSAEMDTYVFTAYSGDSVYIRMSSEWYDCNYYYGCQGNYGPQIRLYAPNGTPIQYQSGINYIELSKKLDDNGQYKILAGDTDMDNTGNYTLYLKIFSVPPASITNLKNITYRPTYINWNWKDPKDKDFAKVIVYLNGKFKANVTKGRQYYNATGLLPNIIYKISTHTVDMAGNINQTWVSKSAKTARDYTPPANISNLKNITYKPTYINWTWKDPLTFDFTKVRVYINGTWKSDVPKGKQFYNATGLKSNTWYKISTRTMDTSGNIGSWVNKSARTAP